MKAKPNKELIHGCPWLGRCSAIPRTAGPHHVEWCLGKAKLHHSKCPPSFFPPLSMMPLVWNLPLVPCPGCVPSLPSTPSLLPCREQEGPWLCVNPAITAASLCYQPVFCTVPKHSPWQGEELHPNTTAQAAEDGRGHQASSPLLIVLKLHLVISVSSVVLL